MEQTKGDHLVQHLINKETEALEKLNDSSKIKTRKKWSNQDYNSGPPASQSVLPLCYPVSFK